MRQLKGTRREAVFTLEEAEVHPLVPCASHRDPAHVASWTRHRGWDGQGVSHCTASHAKGSLSQPADLRISSTAHWPFRDQALGPECWRKHFVYVKAFLCIFSSRSPYTGKPALKNKDCRDIDCFPLALPVVQWGVINYRYSPRVLFFYLL